MFIEPSSFRPSGPGWIEVICGSMFSGKTEELIRRLRRASIAKRSVGIFKPSMEKRFHETDIVSHNASSLVSVPVSNSKEIYPLAKNMEVVGIDEAQFFDEGIADICCKLAENGVRVIVAGLDMDFRGHPFGPMPHLLCVAEYITKVHAICIRCGGLAHHSYRRTESQNLVELGANDHYSALCRSCFVKASLENG